MKTNTDNRTEERRNRFNGESIMLTKEESNPDWCHRCNGEAAPETAIR